MLAFAVSIPAPVRRSGRYIDEKVKRSQWRPIGLRVGSGAALGLEHDRGQGMAAVLAGPDHELEGLEIALAGLERGPQQGLALARRRQRAVQHQALAVHDEALVAPDVEVAEPELLVDLGDELVDLGEARIRHLHLEGAGDVQRLQVVAPVEGHMIIRPLAGDLHGQLVIGGAIRGPIMSVCKLIDEIDRITRLKALDFTDGHSDPLVLPARALACWTCLHGHRAGW